MSDGTKVFEFASRKKSAPTEAIADFQIGDEKFFIRALKDASVAYLVHRTKGGSPDVVIAAVLDFTEKALLPESAKRFEALALDPEAGLELTEIVEVFEHILAVVAANPTGSRSASSAQPPKTGSRSRATSRSKASAAL